jgi:hypothetical protein
MALDTVVRAQVERLARDLPGAEPGTLIMTAGQSWPDGDPLDTVVSLAWLWERPSLDIALDAVASRLTPESRLVFLEPTTEPGVRLSRLARLRHDITGSLWERGFSVIEVRRLSVRGEWGIPWPFVRGTARLTPAGVAAVAHRGTA